MSVRSIAHQVEQTCPLTQETALQPIFQALGKSLTIQSQGLLQRAYEFACTAHNGQVRASQDPFISHPLAVATILAGLRLDPATIAAGLLHDVIEDTDYEVNQIKESFGGEIATLVDGVTKLAKLDRMTNSQDSVRVARARNLVKMFLAANVDLRVILVKLADCLHNMRTISALSQEKQHRIAKETLEIYAPLANRLGIWQIKWELEDLAFKVLEPGLYREISNILGARRQERKRYIEQQADILCHEMSAMGIAAEVKGRPKHIYSIYRKALKENLELYQINDAIALRAIVNTRDECYIALGVVHNIWRPTNKPSGEPGFRDYIGTPKGNDYQSLHTHVLNSDGKLMEVQIRTWEMHRVAEYGVAAHWKYKEGTKLDPRFDIKVSWLHQIMDWREEFIDADEFVDLLKTDVFQDRVYVFTPKGKIIDLPAGSTPIDFAYQIHTEIGHRCRGARVNGKLVGLDYRLKNGDQVEILTSRRQGPSRDWLNPALGYVQTNRARSEIRQWFRRQDREQNIIQGREVLERELKRLGFEQFGLEAVAKLFDYEKLEDFSAAIGFGDINSQQIASKIAQVRDSAEEKEIPVEPPPSFQTVEGIQVQGTGGLLTRSAKCCTPLPGNEIVGYVTRGRGVTIHRRGCPNILRLDDTDRLIEVSWGAKLQTFPVTIYITAYDRTKLLGEISTIIGAEDINIAAVRQGIKNNISIFYITVEVNSIAQLSGVLAKIDKLPNVIEARRHTG
jgi:RelA/SpoT family (p)ppGpp synthetase